MIAVAAYHLQIVTPDGLFFDGEAESLTVRTTEGEICILPHHLNLVAALGMGEARIKVGGVERKAACIGGMLSVKGDEVRLVPTTFEWAEDIDASRAAKSEELAREKLAARDKISRHELELAEARLKRALVRQSVAKRV